MTHTFIRTANGKPLFLESIPVTHYRDFISALDEQLQDGRRLASYFAYPSMVTSASAVSGANAAGAAGTTDAALLECVAVIADDTQGHLYMGRALLDSNTIISLASRHPQCQLFEREMVENYSLSCEDHPWLKPVRHWKDSQHAFYKVGGEGVHEVAVGPVHAGVIEPGHFRFQCIGERVLHLEIALGYQHRDVEKGLQGGPNAKSFHYAETVAGDSTIAHGLCYCQAVEALSHTRSDASTQYIAGIALELERIANHVGDIGALAQDVGFRPTSNYCGRIRGDFLNMTALLCGNRFGRGLLFPGGSHYELDEQRRSTLVQLLEKSERDLKGAIKLFWESQSVRARFEDLGILPAKAVLELGVVGPAARASGIGRDVRFDHSTGIFRVAQIPVSTYDSGDVLGRAWVRDLEIQKSLIFIRESLGSFPRKQRSENTCKSSYILEANSIVCVLNEGWRGEVCHTAITNKAGRFAHYKIVDPSFHNWPALAFVMRNEGISDFPLCNKSFNLSYCGHDL